MTKTEKALLVAAGVIDGALLALDLHPITTAWTTVDVPQRDVYTLLQVMGDLWDWDRRNWLGMRTSVWDYWNALRVCYPPEVAYYAATLIESAEDLAA